MTPAAAMRAASSGLMGYSSQTLKTRAGTQLVTAKPVVKNILSSSERSTPLYPNLLASFSPHPASNATMAAAIIVFFIYIPDCRIAFATIIPNRRLPPQVATARHQFPEAADSALRTMASCAFLRTAGSYLRTLRS